MYYFLPSPMLVNQNAARTNTSPLNIVGKLVIRKKTHPNWILASNKVFRNVLNCIVQCVLQRVITFSWWTKGSTIRLIKRELTLSLRWFVRHSTFERYFNYSNDKKERYLDISYFIFLEDFCLPIKVDGLEKIQIISCIK